MLISRNSQGEKFGRQAQQVETLLKTIFLLTDTPVTVFILNNDQEVFNRTQQDLQDLCHCKAIHTWEVDAGIFLDTDIVPMNNIRNLWNFFHQFNSLQLMGMVAPENYYGVNNLPSFGPPGVGLNGGVALMNLTRMREMSGGGFTGSVR
jgi:hypothetical protein